MITQFLISAMMAALPFYPKAPAPDIPKEYAILTAGEEERKPTSRRERRASMRRKS